MAKQATSPDLVDSQIALTERVRKLELMHATKTLRPWRWTPRKREARYRVIAQHSIAMGLHNRYQYYLSGINTAPGRGAQYCIETELAEGYATPELASAFFRFRQALGVYPQAQFFSYGRGDQWIILYDPTLYGGGTPPTTDFGSPGAKLVHMSGPPGLFRLWGVGTNFHAVHSVSLTSAMPPITYFAEHSHYEHDNPYPGNWGTCTAIFAAAVNPGYYIFDDDARGDIFYTGVRDSYWRPGGTGVHVDCGDPTTNLSTVPDIVGERMMWWQAPVHCPRVTGEADRISDDLSGAELAIIRQPVDHFYFTEPPVPWRGQRAVTYHAATPLSGGTQTVTLTDMMTIVENTLESGYYPEIEEWYDTRLPPPADSKANRYWQRVAVVPPWSGTVYAKIVNCRMLLRGSVTIDVGPSSSYSGQATPILVFQGFDYDSYTGETPAKIELADGSIHSTSVSTDTNAIRFTPSLANYLTDDDNLPVTLHLDGVGFNIAPDDAP